MTEATGGLHATVFRHEKVNVGDARKVATLHARTDRALCLTQILNKDGGETNLHSHPHLDGFWFVLSGRARFYTTGDEVIGELGKHEGILIPRGYPYWFESVSDAGDECELLQIEASDRPIGRKLAESDDPDDALQRVDHRAKFWEGERATAHTLE